MRRASVSTLFSAAGAGGLRWMVSGRTDVPASPVPPCVIPRSPSSSWLDTGVFGVLSSRHFDCVRPRRRRDQIFEDLGIRGLGQVHVETGLPCTPLVIVLAPAA